MRQPNSSFQLAVVSFEPGNARPGLYFFLADSSGVFSATPTWELAGGQLNSATSTFNATTGLLVATLNGSNNDWYRFSAEKK